MKYAIRAIKYFFYYCIIFSIIVGILLAANIVNGSVNDIFNDGYNSLWKIAIMFAVFGAIYPKFGFCKMYPAVDGTLAERKGEIISYMKSKFYVLEMEEDGVLKFHRSNVIQRASRMFEDTVTISQTMEGIELEGLRKDVIILVHGLESKLLD